MSNLRGNGINLTKFTKFLVTSKIYTHKSDRTVNKGYSGKKSKNFHKNYLSFSSHFNQILNPHHPTMAISACAKKVQKPTTKAAKLWTPCKAIYHIDVHVLWMSRKHFSEAPGHVRAAYEIENAIKEEIKLTLIQLSAWTWMKLIKNLNDFASQLELQFSQTHSVERPNFNSYSVAIVQLPRLSHLGRCNRRHSV